MCKASIEAISRRVAPPHAPLIIENVLASFHVHSLPLSFNTMADWGQPLVYKPHTLMSYTHGGTHAALLWKAAAMSFYVSVKVFIDYNAMQTLSEIKGEMFQGEGQFVYG